MINTTDEIEILKADALARRAAAIVADDSQAQREAEEEYNLCLDMQARARSQRALKARITAEHNATEAGRAAAERGETMDLVNKVAKNLRGAWLAGFEGFYA